MATTDPATSTKPDVDVSSLHVTVDVVKLTSLAAVTLLLTVRVAVSSVKVLPADTRPDVTVTVTPVTVKDVPATTLPVDTVVVPLKLDVVPLSILPAAVRVLPEATLMLPAVAVTAPAMDTVDAEAPKMVMSCAAVRSPLLAVTVDVSADRKPLVDVSTVPSSEEDDKVMWLATVTVPAVAVTDDAASTFMQSPTVMASLSAFTVEAASAVMLPLVAAKVV